MRIKKNVISKAVDSGVAFLQHRSACFERHFQSNAVFKRQLDVPNIQVRRQRWMWLCGDRRQGLSGTRKLGIDAYDRVFRGEGGPCPTFLGMTSSFRIRKNKLGCAEAAAVDVRASATA